MGSKAVAKNDTPGAITLSDDLKAALLEAKGSGLEDMGADDYAIPFLKLIQGLSPERDPDDDQYIEGATEGKLFNSVTRQLIDGKQGIEVIPVHIRSLVVEWTPRNQGGGFVAESANRKEAEEYKTPGNELKDTITYTVLYRPYGSDDTVPFQPALLGMESTKLKVARTWNSQLSMLRVPVEVNGEVIRVKPDIFMTRWLLTSVRQENQHGKFYNFAIKGLGLVEDMDIIKEAKQLRETVESKGLRGKDGDVEEPEVGEGGDSDF